MKNLKRQINRLRGITSSGESTCSHPGLSTLSDAQDINHSPNIASNLVILSNALDHSQKAEYNQTLVNLELVAFAISWFCQVQVKPQLLHCHC